jgi:hypothetical protein
MNAASLDREKLARLPGMLGSAHDGEIAAAGRAADALVRQAGLTWPDVLEPQRPALLAARGDDAVAFCLRHGDALTDWERRFLMSLKRQRYAVTDKQHEVVEQIREKIERAEARAA